MNNSIRRLAQELLLIHSPQEKAAAVRQHLVPALTIDAAAVIGEVPGIPGRSERPLLVHPSQLKTRAVGTREGRASLIHALTHIEANAVNLALDVMNQLLWEQPLTTAISILIRDQEVASRLLSSFSRAPGPEHPLSTSVCHLLCGGTQ